MPLSVYIKNLKKTIESSKVFIKSIIEHVRYTGKIKIINQSNENPTHFQYQSSFPDLANTIITKSSNKNINDYYPLDRFDENFDLEKRKKILQKDSNFKNRMNESIQKSYYNDFFHEYKWKVSDQLHSLHNILFTIQKFQEKYAYLKLSHKLEESFMIDAHPFIIMINDHIIPIDSYKKMMQDFKNIIPNIDNQILISTYANEKFLRQAYLQFVSEHPEINQYKFSNSKNTYNIHYLNDGSIKLVATHVADLDVQNNQPIKTKYKSCGVRATIIITPNHEPIMKYSYFII
ncbi:hypothetical protein [Buchnera aphidicola]|uniref:hypothetical protein n=1 Tax=Buchnera aphidicola TaxID=9 RepID=UPI003CE56DC6